MRWMQKHKQVIILIIVILLVISLAFGPLVAFFA